MDSSRRIVVLGSGSLPLDGGLPVHLRGHDPHIEWRIVATRIGGFPFTPLDVVMTELGHVDAALRGARDGADAILLDTYGEYGLAAMRSALSIPVIGAAEAAIAEARAFGGSFGIVTVWPKSMDWLYARQAATLGIARECLGVRYVGGETASRSTPTSTLDAMHRSDEGWLERIEDACRDLAQCGASSVVLGCTCMAPVWEAIAARSALPVICAARAGAKAAVDALEAGGVVQRPAAASREAADRLVAWVDAAPIRPSMQDCPVCIIATESPESLQKGPSWTGPGCSATRSSCADSGSESAESSQSLR